MAKVWQLGRFGTIEVSAPYDSLHASRRQNGSHPGELTMEMQNPSVSNIEGWMLGIASAVSALIGGTVYLILG
ncbi:hypothetical protein [Sphingomonas bacterium]|uniref:hypothetical protein n=1 Tax=Sphingomonas bacterium TaxID=1895847 RepID=UPI0015771733|nr:hypothetical protein [Sphingomonas bacterium]